VSLRLWVMKRLPFTANTKPSSGESRAQRRNVSGLLRL